MIIGFVKKVNRLSLLTSPPNRIVCSGRKKRETRKEFRAKRLDDENQTDQEDERESTQSKDNSNKYKKRKYIVYTQMCMQDGDNFQ